MLLQNISAEHSPCCVLGGIFTEPRGTAQATLASQLLGSGITQTTMLIQFVRGFWRSKLLLYLEPCPLPCPPLSDYHYIPEVGTVSLPAGKGE